MPVIGAGVVGGPLITPFGQFACAKHCSPGGLNIDSHNSQTIKQLNKNGDTTQRNAF